MLALALFAVTVGATLLVLASRFRAPARLAWRHASRHKRQTAIVVVGLLVGTAVISGSLVTGDSLHAGLRDTTALGLGRMDVIVSTPGDLPVPEDLLARVASAPLPVGAEGASRVLFSRAAVEHPAVDRFAPRQAVIGFDPREDASFGAFRDRATQERVTGEELRAGEVYLNARLADRLDARAGDTVAVVARPLFVPVVPDIHWFNGTLAAAGATPDPEGGWRYEHDARNTYAWDFDVPPGARGVVAAVAWPDPLETADLDLVLIAPDGTRYVNDTGTPGAPTGSLPGPPVPVPVPLPAPGVGPLNPVVLSIGRDGSTPGAWRLEVNAKFAVEQPYAAIAAPLRVEYDLERALERYQAIEEALGEEAAQSVAPDPLAETSTRTMEFRVARVVADEEKGVLFGLGAVFTLRSDAQTLLSAPGLANWLKITQGERGPDGGGTSDALVAALEARIDALRREAGSDGSSPEANLRVTPIKQEFLERSAEAAAVFTRFLGLIGSFTLLAGLLLIVNVFTMLGEERRRELAVARAVGMTRARLFLAFLFEGTIYTILAAAAGALAGVALAAFLVWGINSLAPADAIFRVPLAPRAASLLLAFALGALITFATVAFAAWRAGRFDVAAALGERRHLARPGRREHQLQVALLACLAALTTAGILLGSFLALSVGPLLVLFAIAPILARGMRADRAWRLASIAVMATLVAGLFLLRAPPGIERDLSVLARALVIVIAGSILFVRTPMLPRALARLFSHSRRAAAPARVAFSYPQERPLRTGLTLSMYSLVILVLVVFSIFFTAFTPDVTQETGGYDLVGRSPVLAEPDALAAMARPGTEPLAPVARVDVLAEHFEFGRGRLLLDGSPPPGERGFARIFGFDAGFAASNAFPLYAWDARLADSERALWERVAADPGLVIVSYALIADPTQPPDPSRPLPERLDVNATTGMRGFRVAGVMEQTWFGGVWMQKSGMVSLFPDAGGHYLFEVDPGAARGEARAEIERGFRDVGMEVTDLAEEARELRAEATRVYQLLTAYLGLGLIVGVASLGIVTSRAVLKRRRETGVLRALGFTPRMVAWTFLGEVALVLAAAVVLGVGLGVVVARAIFEAELAGIPGVSFVVPWARILAILGTALAATVIAVLVPVQRAARVSPAEAIRRVD